MKKHTFFTGPRGVGKSTLLQKRLENYGNIGGFTTVKRPCGDTFAVYMLPASGGVATESNLLFYCNHKRDYEANAVRFDSIGCRLLADVEGAELIVMDELGSAESCAKEFQQRVLELLDGSTPILGILQEGESDFQKAIASHPNVELIYVTAENRDRL